MKTHKDAWGIEFWVESVGSGQWKIMGLVPNRIDGVIDAVELDTVCDCDEEDDAANKWIEYSKLDLYNEHHIGEKI